MSAPVLRAVIADDEAGARWHLRALLDACRVRILAECATGHETIAAASRARPDLLCLDVRMPDLDGLEVARRLREGARPVIVFTTGYADYAVPAFELDAADYLIKPLTTARVQEAVRRARSRLGGSEPARGVSRLFVPAGDHHVALAPGAVRYVEARKRRCLLHTDDGTHALRVPMGRLEQMLAPHGFLRTHRAYLVNLYRVRALVPWSRHVASLLLDDGGETHVPLAKARLAAFRRSILWIADAAGPHGEGDRLSRKLP